LLDKETTQFIPPQRWPSNSLDLNSGDYSVWGILRPILQEKVKTRITDLDALNQRLRTAGPSWITSSLGQPFARGVVAHQRASRPVVDILTTVSDFRQCTVSDFVVDIDDMSSCALFVGLFLNTVRYGVVM